MDHILNLKDVNLFKQSGKISERLNACWNEFKGQFDKSIQEELDRKGFRLNKCRISQVETGFSESYCFVIPNASKKLHKMLKNPKNRIGTNAL